MPTSLSRPRAIDIIGWCLLAAAILFAIYVRVRLREFPLERDEGEFAYAGQLLREGVPPYKLAYNMKLPGTYIAYAALMTVFGESTAGIHLGLLAVNIATLLLLFRLARELFDPFTAGMAAIVYSILSVSPAFLGMAAHATHFVAFFALAGTWLLWRHLQTGRWWLAPAGGFLMGVAFLMKQQGVFMMVFGGVILIWLGLRLASYSRRKLPLAVLTYSVAAVLPYLLTCLWLWRAGVWDKFWFWTVTYASKYVQNEPLSSAIGNFWQSFGGIFMMTWPAWLLALAGAIALVVRRATPGSRVFTANLLVFSFLCVCPGLYFRQHYFIVFLPAVAIIAGLGCRWLWDLTASKLPAENPKQTSASRKKLPAEPQSVAGGFGPFSSLVVMAIASALIGILWMNRSFYFTWDAKEACHQTYMGNPFIECPQIADYLKAHTSPEDKIAVIGSEPEIFFDAKRDSGTGFIYTYGLVEVQPLAAQMQKEMAEQIEAAKPKYIVFANVRCSWLTQPASETAILNWALNYINSNYEIVGVYDLMPDMNSRSYWDEQLRLYPKGSGEIMTSLFPPPNGIFASIMKPPKSMDPVLKYAAQSHKNIADVLAMREVTGVLYRDIDVVLKILFYPGVPNSYKYCTLPYIMVCKRK